MDQVKSMVLKHLVNNENEIESIERFSLGFLNDNYLIKLKNQTKYVARITKANLLVNHAFEYEMMQLADQVNDFVYYDLNTGNYLRKYYQDTVNGSFENCYPFLDLIIENIKNLHDKPINKKIDKFYNFEMYVDLSKNDGDNYFKLYKDIVLNIKDNFDQKTVISHNDLNPTNILGYKNEVHFIDYEFSCLNYDYFDYGYFLKEIFIKEGDLICLSLKNNWNYKAILSFIYLTCYISYTWSLQMPQSEGIIAYTNKMKPRLDYYFDLLKNIK